MESCFKFGRFDSTLAAADGEEKVGPESLVAGLNGQDMIVGSDGFVEIPFLDGSQGDGGAGLGQDNTEIVPRGRFAGLGVGVIGRDAHGMSGIDWDGAEDGFEDLSDGDEAGGEIQADDLGVGSFFSRGWVIAVRDENFCVMTCATKDFIDLRVDELMVEHWREKMN